MPAWPHAGAIALVERGDADVPDAWHVFSRWRWLGSANGLAAARALAEGALPVFDADEYRIIRDALVRAGDGGNEPLELAP
jgi:DNA polymerase-3 subunit epsilon